MKFLACAGTRASTWKDLLLLLSRWKEQWRRRSPPGNKMKVPLTRPFLSCHSAQTSHLPGQLQTRLFRRVFIPRKGHPLPPHHPLLARPRVFLHPQPEETVYNTICMQPLPDSGSWIFRLLMLIHRACFLFFVFLSFCLLLKMNGTAFRGVNPGPTKQHFNKMSFSPGHINSYAFEIGRKYYSIQYYTLTHWAFCYWLEAQMSPSHGNQLSACRHVSNICYLTHARRRVPLRCAK